MSLRASAPAPAGAPADAKKSTEDATAAALLPSLSALRIGKAEPGGTPAATGVYRTGFSPGVVQFSVSDFGFNTMNPLNWVEVENVIVEVVKKDDDEDDIKIRGAIMPNAPFVREPMESDPCPLAQTSPGTFGNMGMALRFGATYALKLPQRGIVLRSGAESQAPLPFRGLYAVSGYGGSSHGSSDASSDASSDGSSDG